MVVSEWFALMVNGKMSDSEHSGNRAVLFRHNWVLEALMRQGLTSKKFSSVSLITRRHKTK